MEQEWYLYLGPALVIWLGYSLLRARAHREAERIWREAKEAGLTEPASLHPVINPSRCIACGSCAHACPENSAHKVLGLIRGKMELINPTHCIGHGACKAACPADAITLVFGTATRGVDIPQVSPAFESNVPGLFIAGELGGMGLIRNAIEQGKQAMESIRKLDGLGRDDRLDVVIVGAGPAGIAASLTAMKHGLRFVTLEQDSLGGTVAHFPRGKIVMTAPVELPLVGKVRFTETTKEQLLEFWQKVVADTGLEVSFREKVEEVRREGDGFRVITGKGEYVSRAVLLAIGRRGTPRKLGVPGEEQNKVVYRLIDPEQYRGRHVLVVGGGDSALEAATSIAEEEGTTVTLSYRSEAFGRAKAKNRDKVARTEQEGRLRVMMKSNVREIREESVVIEQEGELHELPNDAVIVCAGGILPTPFLKSIGIEVETKYGTE
ncbi:MAG: 4Fe-4S dicluster domain-containing protein [Gammaproteobacteria bacterium]|nr:MAG: 4Fe-4S dicluster domain-containing protein [Gammaproteobacteria bacterium]